MMKKTTLLLCCIFSIQFALSQPVNDEPSGALSLTPGYNFAINAITGTNVGATASETIDPSITAPGCAAYGGGDVWYSVVVPADGNITLETDLNSGSALTDSGLAVYSGTIGALMLIGCDDDSGNNLFSRIELSGRTPGETLYIRVWEFGNNTFDTFQVSAWNASLPQPPANDNPNGAIPLMVGVDFAAGAVVGTNVLATASETIDPSITASGCAAYGGGDVWYSVVVPADGNITLETDLNSGSALTDSGLAVYSGTIGALMLIGCDDDSGNNLFSRIELSGRTPGETLYIRVWEFGNNTFDTFQVSAWNASLPQPPANDNPNGAIPLMVGVDFAAGAVVGTNVLATASETIDPSITAPGCAAYGGGDVWYSVVVPADGNITLETDLNSGSALTDSGLAVYSGTIGALMLIGCDDDSGNNLFSRIELSGRTPGETLYIRVWEFGNNTFDTFQVAAWNPNVLAIDDVTLDGFSYYPNPVKNILQLTSPKIIETVSVYSLTGKEILSKTPKTADYQLDMSSLASGTYLIKVDINGRIATYKIIKD